MTSSRRVDLRYTSGHIEECLLFGEPPLEIMHEGVRFSRQAAEDGEVFYAEAVEPAAAG